MAEKINHWCIICGKGYHACDACDKVRTFTPWRKLADTPEHYQIYLVLKQYKNKVISKAEAKTMLNNIGLADMDSFKDGVNKLIAEIFRDDVANKKTNRKSVALKPAPIETIGNESDIDGAAEI